MRMYLAAGLAALTTTPALAGGIERNPQSMAIFFQQGNYLELGASYARPRVTGTLPPVLGGNASGNVSNSFFTGSVAFKGDINDQMSYAIILDEPYGADTLYPTGSALAGSLGKVENTTLTGVLRYRIDNNFSAYAGLRSSWTKGTAVVTAVLPTPAGPVTALDYALGTQRDQAWGYLLGVAYEVPEIALRAALTYNSSIRHDFTATETITPDLVPVTSNTFSTKLPQSVSLELQTGVAEGTLVFGSIRWVNWKQFDITPPAYAVSPNPLAGGAPRGALVEYQKNSVTYTLGVGRQFTQEWAGSISLAHDTGNGNPTSNLGPTGSRTTLGLGASYTFDNVTISGGVQYARIGSATTTLGSEFRDNQAVGAGIRVGYRF